jgi:hypothetical protein
MGIVRLDVDGNALSNHGRASFGWVFHDHCVNWLFGFSRFAGIASNMHNIIVSVVSWASASCIIEFYIVNAIRSMLY